jgi:DNA-binding transcriptional LysR family regulator
MQTDYTDKAITFTNGGNNMAVKLELYRVFKEVAEAGNITAAAQALFISQSAVSQSVKQLEEELHTRLFSRNSRGVSLTGEGKMLYEYVRSAMGLLETGEEKLSQTRQLQMGELTIGASDTVTSQFLLPYLDGFHRRYPAIHIQIISGRSHKVLGLLQSGKVDIAFASTPADSTSLEISPCFATHSVFVAGADYECDWDHVYSLEEIAAFPLILLERKASSRLYLEKYFLQNGLRLKAEIELGARSLLVDLAKIGFGVAGVTEEFVRRELADGTLRKLKVDFDIPPRAVDMCVLHGVPQTAAATQFCDYVKAGLSLQ